MLLLLTEIISNWNKADVKLLLKLDEKKIVS